MKEYYPIEDALKVAHVVLSKISPHCKRINLAGSIRRMATSVSDIEIVCEPTREHVPQLFPVPVPDEMPTQKFITAVYSLGEVLKGKPYGRYMQIALKEGMKLDLFLPTNTDYFRQLVIRTGSANFVHNVIAKAWVKNGWVGTNDGLRRRNDCEFVKSSQTWKCIAKKPELPPVWQTELEVFEWLNIPFVTPNKRI